MPNNKDISSLLENVKLELLDYINKKLKYIKLDAFEKTGIVVSVLGFGLMVAVAATGMLFFLLFGLAFFLGELLDSQAAGFGILALFSFLVLLTLVACRKKLKTTILNKTIVFMQKLEKNEAE